MKERLLEFLKHLDIGQTKFEKSAGLANGLISGLKGDAMSTETVRKIAVAYPQLNIEWLIVGNGEMLKPDGDNGNYSMLHNYGAVGGRGHTVHAAKYEEIILGLFQQNAMIVKHTNELLRQVVPMVAAIASKL